MNARMFVSCRPPELPRKPWWRLRLPRGIGEVWRRFLLEVKRNFRRILSASCLETSEMIYPIVKFGDPVLEKKAATITDSTDETAQAGRRHVREHVCRPRRGSRRSPDRYQQTHRRHRRDLQGRSRRKIVLVNPEIVHTEGRQTSSEGCLSIPEFREKVTRPEGDGAGAEP